MFKVFSPLCLSLALSCSLAVPALAETPTGVRVLEAPRDMAASGASLTLWYPAAEVTHPHSLGGNAVFLGQQGQQDAALAGAGLPLVMLSHGGLRSARDSGAWLGHALAQQGFVVAEVNGPRPENAIAGVNALWHRAQEVTQALDLLLADPEIAPLIDRDRISVAGFAVGGTAALALSGGRFDADAYAQSCDGAAAASPDCAWFAAQGVTPADVERDGLEQPLHDPRISAAIALFPEYTDTFAPGSLAAIDASLLVVGLTQQEAPWAQPVEMPGVTLFDAFPICTEKAPIILKEAEADAALCAGAPADRAKAHAAIADQIAGFLTARSATQQ